jgi:hypothetical protein
VKRHKVYVANKNPCAPPAYTATDVYAVQALARGTASPDQQRHALNLIVNGISCAFDMSFRPGKPDESTFAEGKRFVGSQIDKLTRLNPATVESIYGRPDKLTDNGPE